MRMAHASRTQNRDALADVLRRARGFSLKNQDELALALGVSKRSVAAYEAGDTEPPATVVLEWLRVCGRPLDDLSTACAPWDLNPEPADYEHWPAAERVLCDA